MTVKVMGIDINAVNGVAHHIVEQHGFELRNAIGGPAEIRVKIGHLPE